MNKTLVLYHLLSLLSIFFLNNSVFAQKAKIEIGSSDVALNEAFTIKITVENDRLKNYSDFPEIDGFVKQGTSSSSSTNIINGQISSSHSIIQNYSPTTQGTFTLAPFTMTINGKEVSSPGATISVGPPRQRQQQSSPFFSDPFDDFFHRNQRGTQEFVDVKEDAFFALTTDKEEVYIGEGFSVSLAWYEAEANKALIQFYEVGKQLAEILKEIKPANSWEENFNIENINGRPITINGKRYTQYKIYQATFYPLNQDTIDFPSVGLDMVKYKIAKNPTFFGQNRKEEIKTYYSKPRRVIVKPLPPHPLKDAVSVGNYELKEDISSKELNTGESFSYNFRIVGMGNVSAINNPLIAQNEDFEFYPPNVRQNINRGNGMVTGTKSFTYYAIPKEPGQYDFGKYFNWVFFNPDREAYDTLSSNIQVVVTGESKKNDYISSADMGSFYDLLETEGADSLQNRDRGQQLKLFANILILLMLVLSAIIIFKS